MNAGGEEFGLDRLVKICERLPAEKGAEAIGRSLSAQICDWAGDTEEADDLTLLVLARE